MTLAATSPVRVARSRPANEGRSATTSRSSSACGPAMKPQSAYTAAPGTGADAGATARTPRLGPIGAHNTPSAARKRAQALET